MSIVRLYNCPYFINGECSLRSHDDPPIDFWNSKYLAETIIPHCPKSRAYCHVDVDVDTDNWSGDTLGLIRTVVNGCRNYNGNTGEIVDIIEQILERRDDMKDCSSETLCVSRKWFEEKQAEARQEGREEAWDLARRIIASDSDCYSYAEVFDLFDTRSFWQILGTPVEEVLAKDKKYQEEKKALHIGDEVEFCVRAIDSKKYRGYITNFVPPKTVRVLTKELGTIRVESEDCVKTGRHSDEIEKVMASFEEEEGK